MGLPPFHGDMKIILRKSMSMKVIMLLEKLFHNFVQFSTTFYS